MKLFIIAFLYSYKESGGIKVHVTNTVGVMQGRLLPKYQGRFQAHPTGYWQKEFGLASGLGLDVIEFILDYDDFASNPLMQADGLREMCTLSEKTGVLVKTICADYFMSAPFHNSPESEIELSLGVLKKLIENGSAIGIGDIVIPCVDQSALIGHEHMLQFASNIRPLLRLAEKKAINLSLETDLQPEIFAELLEMLGSERATVNYDTGNSTYLGYVTSEEFAAYGDRISDIHIKDRSLGGGSVELGRGDTDFDLFFTELAKIDYIGPFILQAYRDDEGVEIFKKQLNWIRPKIDSYRDAADNSKRMRT